MITILGRYIAKTTITATAVVAMIIAIILFLISLLTELKNVGEGDYGFLQAFCYVLLNMPNALYQFSPLLILLGCISGLSILSSYRELAIMRTSGFSTRRIIISAFSAVLLLIVAITFIGERFAPNLSYKSEVQKENLQHAGQAAVTASGVWFHIDDNFIHVEQVIDRQLLKGVTRYKFDKNHHLLATYFAKQLAFENQQWQMKDVVQTTFTHNRTHSVSYDTLDWDLKVNPNLLNVGLVDPGEMSLVKLSKFINYLKKNNVQSNVYQYNFWQRIFQPIASLLMIFLAIPFVLGSQGHTTLGWRMVIGILAGFIFFIANSFLGQLSIVYQLPAPVAAFLPLVIFMIIALFLSRRLIKY